MDAEELHRLLSQVKVRCQLLEVDKEVERLRAAEYRKILLGTLAGEDSSGATQPEVSRILHAATSALARPRLPTANVCRPNLYHGCVLMLTWMALSHHRDQRC